ncbi:MAG: nuclear transport factor 2 family protein [Aureispira sp.]
MPTIYCFLAFVLLSTNLCIAQTIPTEQAQVEEALWAYINGRNTGDKALLERAFHPQADLRYIKKGTVHLWTSADYISRVQPGKTQDCKARIIAIDIEGNAAIAKIEIEYSTRKFVDYINLLKEGETWKIAVKTFSKKPLDQKKILFVVTSHEKMGTSDRKTGLHLGEVSHVYKPLQEAGYEIDFVSPKGGQTYMYGVDINDPMTSWFVQNSTAYYKLTHQLTPKEVAAKDYAAIYYVGGHGTMWDLPNNTALNELTKTIYEQDGIVAAVCHGPSGLVNVQLSNGEYLVKGKKMTSFTDEEEQAARQTKQVPFLLESALRERGAVFSEAENWQKNVVVDGRLITGQNPASAHAMALKMLALLER